MALLFGTNFMASDIAKILEQNDIQQNGIRTWRKLFGNASLGYNAQRGALKSDYSDVIAQAYKSNLAQQNAVASAGLNLGATNELMGLTQQDLHNTYQTYMNNYKQSLSALDENYSNEVKSLNNALLERAQNYADYFSAGVDYFYNHLTGSTYNGADYFSDKGMDWLWENTPDKSLASREQLMNMLFDENGTLTKEGTQFFDAIYNATPYGYTRDDGSRTMSFDEWLSNENSDLREWAASIDNFNYNFARTNKGTANILLGRESTDEKYHRGEYLTKEQAEYYTKASEDELRAKYSVNTSPTANSPTQKSAQYTNAIDALNTWLSASGHQGRGSEKSASNAAIAKYEETARTAFKEYEQSIEAKFYHLEGLMQYQEFAPEDQQKYVELRTSFATNLEKLKGHQVVVSNKKTRRDYFAIVDELNDIYYQLNLLHAGIEPEKFTHWTGKTSGY